MQSTYVCTYVPCTLVYVRPLEGVLCREVPTVFPIVSFSRGSTV